MKTFNGILRLAGVICMILLSNGLISRYLLYPSILRFNVPPEVSRLTAILCFAVGVALSAVLIDLPLCWRFKCFPFVLLGYLLLSAIVSAFVSIVGHILVTSIFMDRLQVIVVLVLGILFLLNCFFGGKDS